MRHVLMGAALLLISGCYYTLVPADKPFMVAFYQIEPQIEWNRFTLTDGVTEIWTVDGQSLQSLNFINGVADGRQLRKPTYVRPVDDMPVFRATMTPSDIEEFVVDTFAQLGFADVEAAGLTPTSFGDLDGFRFSLSMLTPEGLEFDGIAIGTVREEALYMILYTGTSRYYFPKHRADVERIFESIRTAELTKS